MADSEIIYLYTIRTQTVDGVRVKSGLASVLQHSGSGRSCNIRAWRYCLGQSY